MSEAPSIAMDRAKVIPNSDWPRVIAEWLSDRPEPVSGNTVITAALRLPLESATPQDWRQVYLCLRHAGWRRGQAGKWAPEARAAA
jgi:hypothetical protein